MIPNSIHLDVGSADSARQVNLLPAASRRDARIDVLRGIALFMIFFDHIPHNWLGYATLHNFALCDAAEIFVLLAGYSAFLAYDRRLERDGWTSQVCAVGRRCRQLYVTQITLVLITMAVGQVWTLHFTVLSGPFTSIAATPVTDLLAALALFAQPEYLDILPLYIALLALFPVIHFAVRRSTPLALAGSAAVWAAASVSSNFNLPNIVAQHGWYFDPFCWQFLFTIGAVLAQSAQRTGGNLTRRPALLVLAITYIGFALPVSFPWHEWGFPQIVSLPFALVDKSHLAPLRIFNVLAIVYLLLCSNQIRNLAASASLRFFARCGRHSLEVFATGCVAALLGRLLFQTVGYGITLQIVVNLTGVISMILVARWMEAYRTSRNAVSARSPVRAETGCLMLSA